MLFIVVSVHCRSNHNGFFNLANKAIRHQLDLSGLGPLRPLHRAMEAGHAHDKFLYKIKLK